MNPIITEMLPLLLLPQVLCLQYGILERGGQRGDKSGGLMQQEQQRQQQQHESVLNKCRC